MEELNFLFKERINTLAGLFYQNMNKNAGEGFDFSASTHPEERACWNNAVIAFSYINEDPDLLKYQSLHSINEIFG